MKTPIQAEENNLRFFCIVGLGQPTRCETQICAETLRNKLSSWSYMILHDYNKVKVTRLEPY